MKIITDDKISGIITKEGGLLSSDYGTVNVRNDFPGKRWISDQNYDRLEIPVNSSTSAFYVGNLTADTVSYRSLTLPVSVSGITQADPGVVTATSHGFENGYPVYFKDVGGMFEVNEQTYYVANKTDDTFELVDVDGNNIDTTSFTAYVSGGSVYYVRDSGSIILREVTSYTQYVQGNTKIHKQGWADLTYNSNKGIIQLTFNATIDKKSDITTWDSTGGDENGVFTDGAENVPLNEFIQVDVSSIVTFDETTSTDLRTISRDGGSNNIKLTSATAHGFANGDKIFLDSVVLSGDLVEISEKVFEIEKCYSNDSRFSRYRQDMSLH